MQQEQRRQSLLPVERLEGSFGALPPSVDEVEIERLRVRPVC